MMIGGFVVICMIIGEHQKNAKFFDRWRMQKIDDATVKKRANSFRNVLAAYFWEELLLSQSTTSSSPSPWRRNWFRNCCIVALYQLSIFLHIYLIYIIPLNTCPPAQNSPTRIPGSMFLRVQDWQLPPSLRHSGAPHLHLHLALPVVLPVLLEGSAKIQIYFRWTPTC